MRVALLVLLAACGTTNQSSDETCPAALAAGDACSFAGRCWRADTFSSCLSGWCTCRAGRVDCTATAPLDGEACGDELMTGCSYEGTPSCDTPPTIETCSCDETGTWHCECACYGSRTTCSTDPCTLSPQKLAGARCSDKGGACSYPGNVTCTCDGPTASDMTYSCQ